MYNGQLKTLGTPAYLKAELPCGMILNIILNNSMGQIEQKNDLLNDIKNIDSSFITITLSNEALSLYFPIIPNNIKDLFKYLDSGKDKYDIYDYTISTSSITEAIIHSLDPKILSINKEKLLGSIIKYNLLDLKYAHKPIITSTLKEFYSSIYGGLIKIIRNRSNLLITLTVFVLVFVIFVLMILKYETKQINILNIDLLTDSKQVYYLHGNADIESQNYFNFTQYTNMKLNNNNTDINPSQQFSKFFVDSMLNYFIKGSIYVKESNNNEIEVFNSYSMLYYPILIKNNNLLLSTFLLKEYGIKTKLIENCYYYILRSKDIQNKYLVFIISFIIFILESN